LHRYRYSAVGLIVAGMVSVQFGAAFAITLFDELGGSGTVFLRILFAAVILLAVFRPRLRGRSREDLRLVVAFGFVLGLMNWSFYESIERIPLGASVTIEFLGPLAVAVWKSRRPLDLVWVALAATGVVLIADPFGGGGLDAFGVALALFAGALWGTYIVVSAKVGRVWPQASGLAVSCAVAALITLPAGVAEGGGDLLRPELLAAGALVGLACSVIPYGLEMEALRRIPEGVFGVLMSLEPAIAALAGLAVLGQGLSAVDVVAIGLVVVASAAAAAEASPPVAVASSPHASA
jgi:inner membrane transporter RhtA